MLAELLLGCEGDPRGLRLVSWGLCPQEAPSQAGETDGNFLWAEGFSVLYPRDSASAQPRQGSVTRAVNEHGINQVLWERGRLCLLEKKRRFGFGGL